MGFFTRKPAEQLTPWTDAQRYRDNGYSVLPVEKQQAERGPCFASPASYECPAGGGWAWGMGEPTTPEHWVVSVQSGILPRTGGKLTSDDCRRTWTPTIRVHGAGKRTARAIAELAPGALVRLDTDCGDVLAVFKTAADVTDPRVFDLRTGNVSCNSVGAFLVSSPRHQWIGDRSPLNTRRDELAALTWEGASELVAAICSLLTKAA
jgi:hypothetical protein